MTAAHPPSMSATARRVVRRAGLARRRSLSRVPRLRVADGHAAGPPTVWMVVPDWDRVAGGIRKQYRAVDVLNAAGVPAAIVHKKPGFACSWFDHETRIVAASDVLVSPRDVIAVPEIYGTSILDLPAGIPQVIFNQNAFLTLDSLVAGGAAAAAPYVDNPDLRAVTAVSDHNVDMLRYAFPGAPIKRMHYGLDPAVHHPPAEPGGRRIAYMTRRRAEEGAQVLGLLERRGVLDGWEVVAIHGKTELEVAELLRSSSIFLSFSQLEGFGLPPAEALACECLVVGFDGFGGREFFRPPFATSVEDGDVVGFARAVEDLVGRFDADPAGMRAAAAAASQFVLERHSPAVERRDLLDLFSPILEP
jgi:Glycosyl transferases group 1